jgi:hypothetical protein
MDAIAQDLSDFLIRFHQQPDSVSEQIEHYVKHILFLLPPDDEDMVLSFFGIFGKQITSLSMLATKYGTTVAVMQKRIDRNLRHLAITPEWQMVKGMI